MSDFTPITDHEDEAVARLAAEFRKPRIEGVVRAFVGPFQDQEDALKDIQELRWLETATGLQLDNLGTIVGEKRKGKTDEVYRRFLRARVQINTSKGVAENLIRLFNTITESPESFYATYRPAEITIMASIDIESLVITPAEILSLCREIIPAGVTLYHIGWYDNGNAFVFEGNPDGFGFSDVFAPTTGGELAAISAF